MARTTRNFTAVSVALGVVAALATLGVSQEAASAEPATVVLHIENCARVSDQDLRAARAEVARIYRAAGVQIIWSNGPLPIAISSRDIADEPRHLALVLTAEDAMPARVNAAPDSVLGFAAHAVGRAYVFRHRVEAVSAHLAVDRNYVLAWVIVHEVGHLLLPPNSHSSEGIMRAAIACDFATASHYFTDKQSATIRAALAR